MITLDKLEQLGADVKDGMARCLDNEEFYLKLVGMVVDDDGYDQLREAIEAGDTETAFKKAHSLKGIIANVSLTNLLEPVSQMTEDLRAGRDVDYTEPLTRMYGELDKLKAL